MSDMLFLVKKLETSYFMRNSEFVCGFLTNRKYGIACPLGENVNCKSYRVN